MFAFLPPGVVPRIDERPRALALTELRELLDRRPGDPVAAWHAARLLADIALGSDRVDDLRVALENVSTALGERRDALAEETRGYLAMAGGDWDGAAAKMAAAASSARRPAREWATYCRWRSAQAHPEARARLRAESGTSSLTSDRTLQALLVLEEEPLAAVELLRAAVETDPQHQASRYLLGVLLLQRNPDSREGRRHLTRVFEADAVDPEAAFAYLIIQLMDGDRDAARDALRELEQEELVDADLRSRIRATLGVID